MKQKLVENYLEILETKTFRGKELLEGMSCDFLEYLGTHQIDPCNLFVGTSPSDFLKKSLVSFSKKREKEAESENGVLLCSTLQKKIVRWNLLKYSSEKIQEEIARVVEDLHTEFGQNITLVAVEIGALPPPYRYSCFPFH